MASHFCLWGLEKTPPPPAPPPSCAHDTEAGSLGLKRETFRMWGACLFAVGELAPRKRKKRHKQRLPSFASAEPPKRASSPKQKRAVLKRHVGFQHVSHQARVPQESSRGALRGRVSAQDPEAHPTPPRPKSKELERNSILFRRLPASKKQRPPVESVMAALIS